MPVLALSCDGSNPRALNTSSGGSQYLSAVVGEGESGPPWHPSPKCAQNHFQACTRIAGCHPPASFHACHELLTQQRVTAKSESLMSVILWSLSLTRKCSYRTKSVTCPHPLHPQSKATDIWSSILDLAVLSMFIIVRLWLLPHY